MPVCRRLLRRGRIGTAEIEQWRHELDGARLVVRSSIDFMLHDYAVHGGRWKHYCRNIRRFELEFADSTSIDQRFIKRVLFQCNHVCSHRATERQSVDYRNYKRKYLDPTCPPSSVLTCVLVLCHFNHVRSCWNRLGGRGDLCCDYQFLDVADNQLDSFWGSAPAVVCPVETTCVGVGSNLSSTPYAVGTSNSGSSWTSQSPPSNAVHLTGVACSAAEDCVAVGDNGNPGAGSTIMTTTTGGLSWSMQLPPNGTSQLSPVSCPATSVCFGVGVSSVMLSVNRGYAWSEQSIPQAVDGLNAISCPTDSDCTAVGFSIFRTPVVIGTNDSGATWVVEPIPSGIGILNAISCSSSTNCRRSVTSGLPHPASLLPPMGVVRDTGELFRLSR